ncbi:MAG: flagellar hook-basal body complex protein FliE [Gammaproteobacteria bacterium]|nr:MAG: flagellar hook-basal body complex protein FliE [Gammaproteobacteria bacterium]
MNHIDVNQLLDQMRALAEAAGARPADPAPSGQAEGPGFQELLHRSVERVNDLQQTAGAMADAFASGDPNVKLPEVMVALQKASLSFEAVTQVRNKLVDAYKEIMNSTL